MKQTFQLFLAFLLMSTSASAKDYGQALTVRIWDNASAPHSNGIDTPETETEPNRLRNTSDAELYIFPADTSKATGQAVVICPGGGYGLLAIDHEGYEVAQWLAANGITGAVLKYRMPNHHPEVPLEDAEQALRILRGDVPGAEGFTCPKVGIAGFSAGGHLAAMASTIGQRPAGFLDPLLSGHLGRTGQTPPGNVYQPAEHGAHPRAGRDLLAGKPRDRSHAPDAAAALGRRQERAAGQQHVLLHGAERARHRGFDAHLSQRRPRLGHPANRSVTRRPGRTPCWTGSADIKTRAR